MNHDRAPHPDPGHEQHAAHQPHEPHESHESHGSHGGSAAMALSATLHCLTGCAICEMLGLIVGTAAGWSQAGTIAVSVALAFFFGYLLSTLPLLRVGVGFFAALSVVLAADTLSIATMEIVDNAVMALVPGAMDAGLVNPVFWVSMMLAFTAAFFAAYPVNRYLLGRGKGHALTHEFHGREAAPGRGWVPAPGTPVLVAVLVSFMVGGLTTSVAEELSGEPEDEPGGTHARAAVGTGRG